MARLRPTALLVLLLHGAPAYAAEAPDLVLEVSVRPHLLSDSIGAYQHGGDILLPLGEMARLMTLAIRTDPANGVASGYILQEERGFRLDLAAGTVTHGARSESFDPALVRRTADDIYVASRLLASWLPAGFDLDMASLSLQVKPRERLPLQARLERASQRAAGAPHNSIVRNYPAVPIPYAIASPPFADQTLGVDVRRAPGASSRAAGYTAYLTGDLLGTEAALYINTVKQRGPSPGAAARLTLGRQDPDGGLLGPLKARLVQAGAVAAPGVQHISHSSARGNGLLVSNRLPGQPMRADRHSLKGDLPPGWDVELYFNGALVGVQQAGSDGRYAFDYQPLIYGVNEFRLVFHGPLGQVRVERHSFLIEQSMLAAGELAYTVSAQRDEDGHERLAAQFDWGLGRRAAASAALVRTPLYGQDRRYLQLGMQGYLDTVIVNAALVRADDGGALRQVGVRTRVGAVSMQGSHARASAFTSEIFQDSVDHVRRRDDLRLDGIVAGMPFALLATRDRLASGATRVDVSARVAAYRYGTAFSHALHWRSLPGQRQADGVLQASRRVAGMGLSGQIQYRLKPDARLAAVVLALDRQLGAGYLLNLGFTRTFVDPHNRFSAALSKSMGRFGLGLNGYRTSKGEYGIGAQLFVATGRDPRAGRWLSEAAPMAASGAASIRVFVDKNRNGIMDAGEPPVPGAGFSVNGSSHIARTGDNGTAWLGRLPAGQHVDIAVDSTTLEDPQWQPLRLGLRIVPRSGKVGQFDLAVGITGEIDGTAYQAAGGARRPAGDLEIELVDVQGQVVARTTSAADGYYVLAGVAPGTYRLQVAPAQLARLKLRPPAPVPVVVDDEGNFVNGKDFTVGAD